LGRREVDGLRRAYLYTLMAVVLWTTGPLGSKAALLAEGGGRRLTPLGVAFWAILVGWLAMLAVVAARGRLRRVGEVSARGWVVTGLMGLFGWAAYPVGMNFAYTRLPVADAFMIGYLNPVFVVVFQGAAFGAVVRLVSGWEQKAGPTRRELWSLAVGLGLCLAGVVMIATGGRIATRGALGGSEAAAGAAAAVFAAAAWGVYSNLGRFVAVRRGGEARGLADVQNLLAMTFGLVVMGAGLAATGDLKAPVGYITSLYLGGLGPAAVGAGAVIVVMGLLNYAAGYTLWLEALERGRRWGGEHKLPVLTYLVIVLAAFGGWAVLHEGVGPGFWPGAGLIAAGNALILKRSS